MTRNPWAGIWLPGGNLKWTPSVSSQPETSTVAFPRLNNSTYSGVRADLGGSDIISLITTSLLRSGSLAALRVAWAEEYHSVDPSGYACQPPPSVWPPHVCA